MGRKTRRGVFPSPSFKIPGRHHVHGNDVFMRAEILIESREREFHTFIRNMNYQRLEALLFLYSTCAVHDIVPSETLFIQELQPALNANIEVKHDFYSKRRTAKMKLLPSLFSYVYSRVKLFVFTMDSRRRYFIFVCFIYGLEERTQNQKLSLPFAASR